MIGIPIGETTGLRPGARFIAFGVVSGKSPLTPLGFAVRSRSAV